MIVCPYCGNSSGKTDVRGMCISCGGNLVNKQETKKFRWEDADYLGHSGSPGVLGKFGQEISSQPIKPIPSHSTNQGFPTITCYKGKPIDTLSEQELEEARKEWKSHFYAGWCPELSFYD